MERKKANQWVRSLMNASWQCGKAVKDKAVTNEAYSELMYVEKSIQRKIEDALCESQWIPIAEGLPEPDRTVEIWVPSNIYTKIAIADFHVLTSGTQLFSGTTTYPLSKVSHWRRIVGPREED